MPEFLILYSSLPSYFGRPCRGTEGSTPQPENPVILRLVFPISFRTCLPVFVYTCSCRKRSSASHRGGLRPTSPEVPPPLRQPSSCCNQPGAFPFRAVSSRPAFSLVLGYPLNRPRLSGLCAYSIRFLKQRRSPHQVVLRSLEGSLSHSFWRELFCANFFSFFFSVFGCDGQQNQILRNVFFFRVRFSHSPVLFLRTVGGTPFFFIVFECFVVLNDMANFCCFASPLVDIAVFHTTRNEGPISTFLGIGGSCSLPSIRSFSALPP